MIEKPTTPDLRHGPLDEARAIAVRLAGMTLGFLALVWIIYGLEVLGARWGMTGLGIAGLLIDIVLLGLVIGYLNARKSTLAAALGPLLALMVVVLLFAGAELIAANWFGGSAGSFWSLRNLRTVMAQTTPIAVASLGMTLIIISGGIDLAAGVTVALCGTMFAVLLQSGWSVPLALAATLVTGTLAGLTNGVLINALRGVVPFIVTLGTMKCFLGVAKLLGSESTVRPAKEFVPSWITSMVAPVPQLEWIAYPVLPNFAWGVWLALALALATALLLNGTVFGRHIFALGSSESTARLCGVNVPRTRVAVYALGGLFFAVAGLYSFARIKQGEPTSGIGLELRVIAAVVIGGGSLSGGRGSVVGTLTGAAIMQTIESGCTMLGLKNSWQDIVIGVVLVSAAALDQFRQRKMLER